MGHALNNTLQDILGRFERMRGKDVLWQPGTDHAGIATQMVVERQLMERQEPGRRDMGREKFLERVWAWKAESGGTIINQLKRLGASCDWSRERFTMDEGLSKAVLKVFVALYNEGLIYKDKRLVNWDPKLLTAISDLEGAAGRGARATSGTSTIRSKARDEFIVVATTRPETMLGDTAVAVHPENEKLEAPDRQERDPAAGRPPHSDRRRRLRRSGEGHRRGEDHAGARLQRLRGRQAARPAAGQRARHRRQARAARTTRRFSTACRTSAELDETMKLHGVDRFKARKIDRRAAGDGGLARQDRAAHAHGAARRPLQRGDRAVPDRPVVRQRQGAGGAGDRRGARGQDQLRAEELGEDLFRLDGEHPAVVHLAPALVGPSNSGVVRAGRQGVRRRDRGRGGLPRARLLRRDRRDQRRRRRATWRRIPTSARRS